MRSLVPPLEDFPLELGEDSPYYFDEAAADRVVRFFVTLCRFCKGDRRGEPFELERWQEAAG